MGKHISKEGLRKCYRCKKIKPLDSFGKSKNEGYGHHYDCKECHLSAGKKYSDKIKQETFSHYGNGHIKCLCCGEKRIVFLTLDHIVPILNKRHKLRGGAPFFAYLKRIGYPKGFQVLCYNCNMGKRCNIMCPHQA